MTKSYIEQTLQKLHIKKRYKGYRFLVCVTVMALEDEDRMSNFKNQLFWPVANQYGCKASNVDRNIRTVACKIWEHFPNDLQEVAGYSLNGPPSSSELIEIVVNYVQRTYLTT